jgi:hypothetical protein
MKMTCATQPSLVDVFIMPVLTPTCQAWRAGNADRRSTLLPAPCSACLQQHAAALPGQSVPLPGVCRHSLAVAAPGGGAGAGSPHPLPRCQQRAETTAWVCSVCADDKWQCAVTDKMLSATTTCVAFVSAGTVPTCNQCARECRVLEVRRVPQHAEGLLLQQQDTGCWLCTMMSQDR